MKNKEALPTNMPTLTRAGVSRTLGRRLRYLRGQLGVAQEAVARSTGMDRSYIGKLERGEVMPRLSTLMRLAEYFAIDISFLFASSIQMITTLQKGHNKPNR